MTNENDTALLEFQFRAALPRSIRQALGMPERITFTLKMTQSQFEDHHHKRDRVHAELARLGLLAHEPAWLEEPPVDPQLLLRLHAELGCSGDAQLCPYYAHSEHFKHYKPLTFEGREYRYMEYQGGRIVKIAPDTGQWPTTAPRDEYGDANPAVAK